jgi:serine/threonine protein kinase/Tol biopolymer transport system component
MSMAMQPGQMLLHYRLVDKIGEGGMGVVWRALDTTLDREVAIKFLPEGFTVDPDRMARFEREAKLLATMNHPSIAAVYGLHEHDGIRFIAMEFVPGETLADRLTRGVMPLDECLDLARQVADALEAAHDGGVIHRDLKPANIRITADGAVKVLDFGLAKSVEEPAGGDPSLSPTVTSGGTAAGVILGTAAYMSPEQARGRAVNQRTDVWAFGCLLFECLTGGKAFPGETVSDTLATVLKSDPDWGMLPAATPESLRRLLRRCLAKDPRRRLSSFGDARLEIEEAIEEAAASPARPRSTGRWSPWLVLPIVAGLVLVALAIFFTGRRAPSSEGAIAYKPLTHQRGSVRSARVSPDGHTIIYSAAWEGRPLQLFLQRLDSMDAMPVELEPRHARLLSISSQGDIAILLPPEPDTVMLWAFRSGTLARVPITGGTPRAVAEDVEEADWDPSGDRFALARRVDNASQLEYPEGEVLHRSDGYISGVRVSPSADLVAFIDHPYVDNNRGTVGIVSRGGELRMLSAEMENMTGLAWSPGGDEVWFSGADDDGLALFAVSLSGELRVLRRSPDDLTLYDTTPDGRLLVAHGTFRLGVAAKVPGETVERDLSWMGSSFVTDLSADGERILFMEQRGMDYEAWLRRTDGAAPTRLGSGMSFGLSPDGKWALACLPSLAAPLRLLPTGAGTPRALNGTSGVLWATWLPDGKRIVWASSSPKGKTRFHIQNIDGGEPRVIFERATEVGALRPFRASPDGRWVAVLGADDEITLHPIEGGEPRRVAGARSGDQPFAWTEDGSGLLVARLTEMPAQVYRLDLGSGARSLLYELMPRDPAGIGGVYGCVLTPDGQGYAYTYARRLDTLHLVTGVN